MEENIEKTLPKTPESDDRGFYDPVFDAAVGKAITDALEDHSAVPDDGGARFLMVQITLAEYRQLCRDSAKLDCIQSRMWSLEAKKTELQREVERLREDNRKLAELAAKKIEGGES